MAGVKVFGMGRDVISVIEPQDVMTGQTNTQKGLTLSTVLMWIKQTMMNGNMVSDEILRSNAQLIKLRQAAFQFSQTIKYPTASIFESSIPEELFEQFRLTVLRQAEGDLLDFSEAGDAMRAVPGYYLFHIKNADSSNSHSLGLKFTNQGDYYLFDPNSGLFQFQNAAELVSGMDDMEHYKTFIGGQYWYQQLTLG